MAFSVAQMYPGAFTADVNFVDGKYKNSSAPGVYDGTPLDNLLFNQNLALFDALMLEAGLTYNNSADIPSTSQLHKAMQIGREVSPRNNDWNGYLDREHQLQLPAPNGYPGNTGGGAVSYANDDEISSGIFAGIAGATVGADSDGWIFTGSIYKEYDYTAAQLALIDVNKVPVYLKGQDGSEYFADNATTGVTVEKIGGKLRVTISDAIFASLGITKLWRFFVTEKVGRVVEKSAKSTISSALGSLGFNFSGNGYQILESGLIIQWGSVVLPTVNVAHASPFPVPFPNLRLKVVGVFSNDASATQHNMVNEMSTNNAEVRFSVSTAAPAAVRWIAIGY